MHVCGVPTFRLRHITFSPSHLGEPFCTIFIGDEYFAHGAAGIAKKLADVYKQLSQEETDATHTSTDS